MAAGKRTTRCVLDEWTRVQRMRSLARTHLKQRVCVFLQPWDGIFRYLSLRQTCDYWQYKNVTCAKKVLGPVIFSQISIKSNAYKYFLLVRVILMSSYNNLRCFEPKNI